MTIDQASFEPVYRQLARILRDQIHAGALCPGAALPSGGRAVTDVRGRPGCCPGWDALASLRADGLVITTRGIGTFVREPAAEINVVRVGAGTRVAARVATADERQQLGFPRARRS